MADRGWPTAIAVVVVGALFLNTCNGSPTTGAKAAVGGAAVGAGVGVGIGAGAAGAGAAGAVKRGASKRVEDAISGRNRPQSPRQPRTPVTQPSPSPSVPVPTTRPAPPPTTAPPKMETPDWCVQLGPGTCVTVRGQG